MAKYLRELALSLNKRLYKHICLYLFHLHKNRKRKSITKICYSNSRNANLTLMHFLLELKNILCLIKTLVFIPFYKTFFNFFFQLESEHLLIIIKYCGRKPDRWSLKNMKLHEGADIWFLGWQFLK